VLKTASIELGRYQLLERIGEGGSGQVYRARGPDGTVAVKLLGPASDLDDAARARFRRELGALASLSHPNLISLIEHDIDAELGPYLVLPLLPGANLRAVVGGHAMCPEAALLLLQPIAEATAALHAAGYVHRDLKPENAIAGPDGSVTVIDLGLAWRDGMTRHTETGTAVGSIGYMAPEQVEGRQVDTSVDVWALGVMLYEWIAGRRPFARARPAEEAAAVLVGACSRLTAANRRASEPLADLVARCLALDPAKRPTAAEVVAAITEQLDWTDAPLTERAAVIADPAAYQARIAPFRVRRLARTAREAIGAGQPFAALALCDRGLAYAPDHAELLALVADAEAASGTTRTGDGPQFAVRPETGDGPPFPKPRRWPWLVGAGALLAFGIGAGARLFATDMPTDPWAIKTSPTGASAPAAAPEPERAPTRAELERERDRELARGFLTLFGSAMANARDRGAETTTASNSAPSKAPSGPPSTARGWLDVAATQAPAQAVTSIRKALELNPTWPEAQAALCGALLDLRDDGALGACEAALQSRPGDTKLHGARGTAYLRAGKSAQAIDDLTVAIAGDPSPVWRRLRADAKAASGDAAGATRDREMACQQGDAIACGDAP
jgi:tetratricopeptide (TPR) repeat protein